MADRFYGLDRGDNEFTVVTEQATSPTKDVEIAVDLAVSLEKSEVLQLIDMIKNHIIEGDWPPA
jgi:hypothetical protein